MAVQRRVNWISQQRVDVPDMRSVESAASNDFDQLIQAFVTGNTQGYIMRGFNILMAGAIGGAASGLQLQVDPGALLHINASQSGTVLMVPVGTPAQQLNAATNTNVTGAFAPSSINYVTIDYVRFIDDTTSAQVYIWDPTTNNETTLNAPRAQILEYTVNISTATPTPNLLPVAIVLTDAGNNALQITDARWLLCRLGTGGATPDPFYTYPWPQGRNENPSSSNSNSIDPFSGGDKAIGDLKTWMNAVMSSLQEIKGTTYWYSLSSSGSLQALREDLGNTVITGSGNISHGIIPNSTPVLVTTGDLDYPNNIIENLASTAGLAIGQFVFGIGVPANTTVLGIAGNDITLSENVTQALTGVSFSFYDPSVITGPGQINWDKSINIRVIGSELDYILSPNPTSSDLALADDEAAYITLVRGQSITPNLIFTNGVAQVTSVGAVSWTSLLAPGDFVKLASNTNAGYYLIDSVDSLTQVTLSEVFAGASTGAPGAQAEYAFGTYNAVPSPSSNRDIFIAPRASVPVGENIFWLFLRNDNGGDPRVYIRFLGAEMDNGEDREVSGTTSNELLKYIGSPMAGASQPQYVSALNPGSDEQISLVTFGTAAQTNQSSYFLISSSGNARKYYIWFNKDGGGTDPAPAGGYNFAIEVAISTGQTAAQIAAAAAFAINAAQERDFLAVVQVAPAEIEIINTSAGATDVPTTGNMISPFTIVVTQNGTGTGNNFIHDGDNLTLAIKELDKAIGEFFAAIDSPTYDETIDIVVSGATPPTSLNGPVSPGTIITLPNNSRLGNIAQKYTVGNGNLEVFLNGVYLRLGSDWDEVGSSGSTSSTFEILRSLQVGDSVELRLLGIGSGASGGTAVPGPPGPQGVAGPAGTDAVGGPVAISTKVSNYSVMAGDNVLLANCAVNNVSITFSLPNAASVVGQVFYFKKIDVTANAMIVLPFGSQTIDGASSLSTTTQYESFMLVTDGTNWYIF